MSVLNGDATALAEYRTRAGELFRSYLRNLEHYYGLEERYRDTLFWARRRQRRVPVPSDDWQQRGAIITWQE